jgi:hypothetical protein
MPQLHLRAEESRKTGRAKILFARSKLGAGVANYLCGSRRQWHEPSPGEHVAESVADEIAA